MTKKIAILITVFMIALIGVVPASATNGVNIIGVDGFANGCDAGINLAGFTVRFDVAGDVTINAQAYTEFLDETTVIGATSGGGDQVSFTINAPFALPENTVVQFTITNGDPDNADYVAVNCTTGEVYLERLLGADGRLLAGDDLPVVIFPRIDRNGNAFLDFYSAYPTLYRGLRTLQIDSDTIAELPENPSQNIELGTTRDGLATVYYLTSGEFQVNFAPDEEGKVRVVIFDGLSPTRIVRADYPN